VKQFGGGGRGFAECHWRRATSVPVAIMGVAIERGGDIVPLQKLLLRGHSLFSVFLQPVVSICSPLQTLARTYVAAVTPSEGSSRMTVAYVQLSKYQVHLYMSCVGGLYL
jgi:hypothetical protein